MLTKSELRQEIQQRKRVFCQQQLAGNSLAVIQRLYPLLDKASTVLLCYPLPDEVDTSSLIDRLQNEGKRVLLPRVTGSTTMELRQYNGKDELQRGAFGILEPTGPLFTDYDAIDIAVIPGVAFDAEGHRLGRGRGYYDRLLADKPYIYKIGVCFDFQKVPVVPSAPHDIRMDIVV